MEPTLTSARTPRHDLPYLYPGQAQKEAFVNEALARLDCAVQCRVVGIATMPPASPADGEAWLVGPAPGGEWEGRDGQIASWAATQWLYQPAHEGAWLFDTTRECFLRIAANGEARVAEQPVAPEGGTVQDSEARATLAAVVANLRHLGIFA